MVKKLILLLFVIALAIPAFAANEMFWRYGLTGGATGALDDYDVTINDLDTGEFAAVLTSSNVYFYYYNSTSGETEASPMYIAPDEDSGGAYAGDGRWVLSAITSPKFTVNNGTSTTTVDYTSDDLYIQNNDADGEVYISAERTGTGASVLFHADPDGAATLYYNNSAKLATSNTGATLTGILVSDGVTFGDSEYIMFGAGPDAKIGSDGANLVVHNGALTETIAEFIQDGAVNLFHNNAKKFETATGGITITGNIVPEADGTRNLGTQTTGQWANVWSDLLNGSDFSLLNGWRILESEKYEGYPEGIAIGNNGFVTGKVDDKMPLNAKPLFVITEEFIEYKGVRVTANQLESLLELIE